ncbi:MAG: hypothetical protein CL916_07040 [Deltaproteobacteria bacterium]|nr:hypothetical protein [Deltaproteobacteria bacterium]
MFFGFVISTIFACSQQKTPDSSSLQTLTHDGVDREFGLFFPSNYDASEAIPLVVNIHGGCMDAASQMAAMNMRDLAEEHNFALVYPQGLPEEGSEDCLIWNSGPYATESNKTTADDLGFFESLITDMTASYAIDSERIYATGFSNGGFMTYALACYQSNTFAAVAPVAGMMTPEALDSNSPNPCVTERPMPIIHFHGSSDSAVAAELGDEAVDFWVARNNTTQSNTNSVEDGPYTIEHSSYTDGDNGSAVEYYKIIGGYHETFDGMDYEGQNSLSLIWDFFSQYDINGMR